MNDRNDVEQVVRGAYAARVRGDIDATCRHFAANARFQMAGSPQASSIALSIEGADALRKTIEGMIKTFELSDHTIVSMVVEGSKAAVHWRAKIKSTITGETVSSDLVDLIEVKDGRIVSFLEFCDTALVARLMSNGPISRQAASG